MFASPVLGGNNAFAIKNSLRFRASASAYLSRTFGTPTSQNIWTLSFWAKRGAMGSLQQLFQANVAGGASDTTRTDMYFASDDSFTIAGGTTAFRVTNAKFRDPSAHYHFVISVSLSGTVNVSVNGVAQTFATSNTWTTSGWNSAVLCNIGRNGGGSQYFDGYLSEVNFIDGQALTPSAFGLTDPATGQWMAKRYSGTYGSNGFYLPFDVGTSAATLAEDRSGNANNWTPTNISVAAGVTYDWMLDTPAKNYCTINTVWPNPNSGAFSEGGLVVTSLNAGNAAAPRGTFWTKTGKFYFESESVNNGGYGQATVGVTDEAGNVGYKWSGTGGDAGYTTYGIYATAFDADTGKVWLRNSSGVWVGSGDPVAGANPTFTLTAGTALSPLCAAGRTSGFNNSGIGRYNFGQRPFTYSPPAGFKALHTGNMAAPAILNPKKHFDIATFTGNGATQSVTGIQFSPDFIWGKSRGAASSHRLIDRIRGNTEVLYSDLTSAGTTEATALTSFNSDGYTMGGGSLNPNTTTMVDWLWKAGGASVTNTRGSIPSQVSANPAAGFSIVTMTMPAGGVCSWGHGLGVAPKMVIMKSRNGVVGWPVWHASTGINSYTMLNTTAAVVSGANNFTAVSSATVSLGSDFNNGFNYVAYCFAEVPGFSKIGSYTGNGSADGPFVYTGLRSRWLMVKRTDSTGSWYILDTARDTYNVMGNNLYPNQSAAEGVYAWADVTANGFKVRNTGIDLNASGGTYIFMAIAESPFGGYNSSGTNAR